MSDARADFRRFALDVHAADGVSDAAILLQDRCGTDVDVLLFAAFVSAVRGKDFDADDLEAAHHRVQQWQQEVVAPLRSIRRRLKEGPAPASSPATTELRERIKKLELDAEMIELDELGIVAAELAGSSSVGDAAERAAAAMRVVVEASAGREPAAEEHQAIDTLAVAAATQDGRR
jgi:uncharacterized protein (TIGR02444 family)